MWQEGTMQGKIGCCRTPTAPDVTGRPKISSRTTTTRATSCSPRYHPEGEVSTGASKRGPRDWKTYISRPSDCSTAINNIEWLLPTYWLISSDFNHEKMDVINVSLATLNNATLYNVYIPYITHLTGIYCTLYHLLYLVYAVRPSLSHIFVCTYSY